MAGYWQIKDSQEKTAFITQHGLYEFTVMHLGVMNAPAVAKWWTKLYGSGIKRLEIVHRAGTHNQYADAQSWQPVSPATP